MYILVTPLPGLVDRGLSWPVVERACRARKPTITHARHVSLALPYLNCALMPRCSGGISVRFLDILLSVLSYVCTRQYNDIHFIPPHNGTMNAYEWFIPCVPQGSKSLWKSSCGVLPLRKSGEGEMYNRYRPTHKEWVCIYVNVPPPLVCRSFSETWTGIFSGGDWDNTHHRCTCSSTTKYVSVKHTPGFLVTYKQIQVAKKLNGNAL